ncbi:MAG: PD-(D/E)XK nuclease family protein [Nitrospirota bacterium]|nr:PD-(D/E)XK nuclease family protein [Nitrospirota bacterium]
MSIKVFYTPFRYKGITETLFRLAFDRVKGHNYSSILYIAPTPRKIRDSQQKFHELIRSDYIPPEMMTIKQLSKRLCSIHGDKIMISHPIIPVIISQISGRGIGVASLIADFINEVKQYHPDKDIDTIHHLLKDIFYELNIPEDVSHRAMETFELFKKYQEFLTQQSVLDENDVMTACPSLIQQHGYSPEILILDGFYELTRSEEEILRALLKNAKYAFISMPYDNIFNDITDSYNIFINNNFKCEEVYLSSEGHDLEPSYYSYPGKEEEIEGIAKHIKHSFMSGKMRDLEKVIITFPKLYEYSDMADRIFRRFGIPFTLYISEPAGKTRPFLDLVSMLESVADEYTRLPFSRFLTSPYFKNLPLLFRKWIPVICLRAGIIKGKDTWLSLNSLEIGNGKGEFNDLSILHKELKLIFKSLARLESIRNNGSYSQYCEVIMGLLKDLGFSDVTKDKSDLMEQAAEIFNKLSFIDNVIPYSSRPGFNTLRQFTDSLKHVLNNTFTEKEGIGVQVMDFFETRGIEPEYIYLGGLKDGDLPSKPGIDHILPDSVRTKFGLVNLKKYLLLQKFLFYRTISSTNNFHLSYPVMEGDKLFLPSPFLPWKREAKEQIPGTYSKEEELITKGKTPLGLYIKEIEDVGDKLMIKKYGENTFIRVTDIDSYRTCPRKFFIEKALQLNPPEIKEYEIERILLGIIAHEIMQNLLSQPFENADDLRSKAAVLLEKLLFSKPLGDYWKYFIKESFLSILPDIYELECTILEEGYSFMQAEVSVEGEIIKGIKLRGKIDRIDKKNGCSIEIIDYKTGTTQFSGPQVVTKGATLQLFLYAALMKSLGYMIERVGIYSLKDLTISWIPGRNDRKFGRTIEDYIGTSLKYLEETVVKLRAGKFYALPLNEQTCRNCSERPYCPYIQKTITGEQLQVKNI